METYAFRLSDGRIGAFQIGAGRQFLFIPNDLLGFQPQVTSDFGGFVFDETRQDRENEIIELVNGFLHILSRSSNHPRPNEVKRLSVVGKQIPRMGTHNVYGDTDLSGRTAIDEFKAFKSICDALTELFYYIEPSCIGSNLKAYGQKIREILILACTEVEFLLRKFLVDNGYAGKGNGRYTTNDYVACKDALRVADYSAKLLLHHDLGEISPFAQWSAQKPTESLEWYDAYNSVKHDRGGAFSRATLANAISAGCGIHVLLESQYGARFFDSPFYSKFTSPFITTKKPTPNLEDLYCPTFTGEDEARWEGTIKYFER
ncbi:MAG: hypothetical protein ACXW17_08960 [Methylomagnum sp.]